ncbi:lipocalin-like domain-containing protein [Myroides fluvii]|uniref:lipocalin family protein n=1 Tax=Myroides fluvii TaxID=2572594 RepID=UPI00131E5366|nr:lipocalin family protein [Myroides fluvii]
MRKFFLLTVVAVLGLATVGCSSDDSGSSKFDKSIQGVWKESRIIYLDKNMKVIDEEHAYDEGCGFDEIEFKGSTMFVRAFFKTIKGCDKDEDQQEFSIKGDRIYIKGTKESARIIEITNKKLVIEGEYLGSDYTTGIKALGEWVDPYEDVKEVHIEYVR